MNPAMAQARRRLTYVTPENVSKVLRHPRYWSMEFLQAFCRRCEEERFAAPAAVLRLLEPAQDLVGFVFSRSGSATERSWRMKIYALEGEVAAWAGAAERTEQALERAWNLLEPGKVQRLAAAELFRRQGAVARLQGRIETAEARLRRSIELYPNPNDSNPTVRRGLAEALVLRGSLGKPCGFPGLAAALTLIKPSTRKGSLENALFEGALWWLHHYIPIAGLEPERLESTLVWLRAAYRKWLLHRNAGWNKVALWHAEARLLQRLGVHRHAERRLLKTARMAENRKLHGQLVLCALDLAYLRLLDGRPEAAERTLTMHREALVGHGEFASILDRVAGAGCLDTLKKLREDCEQHVPAAGYARFAASRKLAAAGDPQGSRSSRPGPDSG